MCVIFCHTLPRIIFKVIFSYFVQSFTPPPILWIIVVCTRYGSGGMYFCCSTVRARFSRRDT